MLTHIEGLLQRGIQRFRYDQAEKAAKQQQLADEKYQRQLEKAEAKAEAGQAVTMPVPTVVPTPQKTIETDAGKVTFVKHKSFDIPGVGIFGGQMMSDPPTRSHPGCEGIPDDYFVLDVQRIAKVYRAGGSVPGCVARDVERPTVR